MKQKQSSHLWYYINVEPIHKHANSVFISRPLRAAQYQEMAIRYGLVQQLSRPLGFLRK